MTVNGTTNGVTHAKPFPPGIHVPSLTCFLDNPKQTIDWEVQEKHLHFLIKSGLHGIVLAGTNGEAVTLSSKEKAQLISRTRDIANSIGRSDLCITAGCVAQSTHEVIEQTIEAQAAGADYALVLVASYFHFAMNAKAIVEFFTEVADNSPIPILIYNYPGVVAGLDVTSDLLDTLGRHPNIVGVKLTCGGIAKVTRIAATFPSSTFAALAGQSDWLVPALSVGGTGCITGLANLFPKTCLAIYNNFVQGNESKAKDLQLKAGMAEWAFAKGGINGTKWVVAKLQGYPESSSWTRRPYPRFEDQGMREWIVERLDPLLSVEAESTKV